MNNLIFGADGVAKGNFAGINIWCICGVYKEVTLPVKDSKKTTKKQRVKIVETIRDKCVWALGCSEPIDIDIFGIKQAEQMSLLNAYKLLWKQGYRIETMYGDLDMPEPQGYIESFIKLKDADDSIPAVSAASIFAKYALDLYWERVHEYYPEYDFINNAGYGTKAKEAIAKYGLIPSIHRESYKPCKEYLALRKSI